MSTEGLLSLGHSNIFSELKNIRDAQIRVLIAFVNQLSQPITLLAILRRIFFGCVSKFVI